MGEQDRPVGHCNHVIVEGAGGNRFLALRREDRPGRVESMEPSDRPRRLDMLPRRKWPARHAIDEYLHARLAMRRRQPHMIGRALVAERGRDRLMNREGLVRERQLQLRQRRRPLMAAMRHRLQIRDRQVAFAVLRVGRWADRRGVGRPHRRSAHCIGGQCAVGVLDVRPKLGQPLPRRPRLRHENSLHEAERQIGAHLVESLERRRPRLRHVAGVAGRGEVAEAQSRIIMAGPDNPVEVDFADHLGTASTRSPGPMFSMSIALASISSSPLSVRFPWP